MCRHPEEQGRESSPNMYATLTSGWGELWDFALRGAPLPHLAGRGICRKRCRKRMGRSEEGRKGNVEDDA